MAMQRKPNSPYDPYDPEQLRDPINPDLAPNEMRPQSDLDRNLQADPELAEGPASNTRITLFAIGIALILGIVFYGLNSSTTHQASTAPTQVNRQVGTTTGNAPATPQTPSPSSTAPGGANTNTATPSNAPASK